MYTFQDVGVYINDITGVIAQSAVVNQSNSLSPNQLVGVINTNHIPNGPVKTEVSIEYLVKVASDPIINEVESENQRIDSYSLFTENVNPLVLKVGNLSGTFFLSNCKFSFSTDNIATASASFVGYGTLSGLGEPKPAASLALLANAQNEIGHGLTTSIVDYSSGEEDITPLYGLEYSFSRALNPIYKIGSKEPIQVLCGQISKNTSLTLENFRSVDFSGAQISSLFNGKSYIKIQGYTSLETTNNSEDGFSATSSATGDEVLLSMKGMNITKSSTNFSYNDMVRTTIQAESIV